MEIWESDTLEAVGAIMQLLPLLLLVHPYKYVDVLKEHFRPFTAFVLSLIPPMMLYSAQSIHDVRLGEEDDDSHRDGDGDGDGDGDDDGNDNVVGWRNVFVPSHTNFPYL